MGIAPNTELYLLKGIPLDSDYSNTIHFQTEGFQQRYFFDPKHIIKYFNNSSNGVTKAIYYQRKDEGILCVGLTVSQCFNCNYMAFKNSSHENKWFYAFVTKVEYANEKACYIHYQIDVMQTWMFDYNLGMSFIERQHHPTDRIGENLVPENLECGGYISSEYKEFDLSKMCVAIITSKPIPEPTLVQYLNELYGYNDISTPQYSELTFDCGDTVSGVYNSLYCYYGFTLADDEEFFTNNANDYIIQSRKTYKIGQDASGNMVSEIVYVPLRLEDVIKCITSGKVNGVNEDHIVSVFQYPAWLSSKEGSNPKRGVKSSSKTLTFSKALGKYTAIKNNKLLTAPYSFMRCSNNAGVTSDYNFEDFTSTPYAPSFNLVGSMYNPPCLMLSPINYKGLSVNYDNGIILNSFPVCAFVGDAYGKWLSENKNALAISMLSSVVGMTLGGFGGFAAYNAATSTLGTISAAGAMAGSIWGGVDNITKTLGKIGDLRNTSPAIHGHIQCESLNLGINRVKFTIHHLCIKPEFAKIIDDYFTMYGYATKEVMIPNITSRPHWNYIKTINANILPTSTTCIPSDDLHRIRSVYDHGITFWHNGDEVGDYSFDNSPITTYTIEEET